MRGRDSDQLVIRRFIAAEHRFQRLINRATTVSREQRSLFPTEMRKPYKIRLTYLVWMLFNISRVNSKRKELQNRFTGMQTKSVN